MSVNNYKIECLKSAAEKTPEYADIVPLFIEVYRYLDTAGSATGISINIQDDHKKRLDAGFPTLSPTDVMADSRVCGSFLAGAVDVFQAIGRDGDEELANIKKTIDKKGFDYEIIFRGILERNRSVIDEAAAVAGVSSPLLEYLFEIPLKYALEQVAATLPREPFEGWEEGYCPVCGSRPGMAEFQGEEGRRILCCSTCNFKWKFKRLQCPFCNNSDPEKLSYITAGDAITRIDTCKGCSRYIKTRDSRKSESEVPLDIEDLLTLHLDLLASKEGLERGK